MGLDISLKETRLTTIYEDSITHNLNKMADCAGIYQHLWRPEEIGISCKAQDLI